MPYLAIIYGVKLIQELNDMKLSPPGPRLTSGLVLFLIFAFALLLRVYYPYDKIFVGEWVKFASNDAYYQMRLVDNILHNFPHLTAFDPYIIFPGGSGLPVIHFFNTLLAGVIWVIGLGSPSEHLVNVIGVYFPAVLGALTVIPVFFIGKELFNRWAGLVAAALLAILPGEFLGRSILGFTDQHVAETLFTAVTMLFLILAIKAARQRQLTLSHLKSRDWATLAKPTIYSLLAGFSLGIYLITWGGALLFVFIISAYFIIQFIIDHLRHQSTDYLCFSGVILFSVALIMSVTAAYYRLGFASLVIALLIPLGLYGVSRLMAQWKLKPVYYPLTVIGLGAAGVGVFYALDATLVRSMLDAFGVFTPSGAGLTTLEMQPIFSPRGDFSFAVVWGNFPGLISLSGADAGLTVRNVFAFMTTTLFVSLVSAVILIYLVLRRGRSEQSLLVVWSLVIVAATLGQRRFAYYLVVNVALLTGYLSVLGYYIVQWIVDKSRNARTDYMTWQILELPGIKEPTAQPVNLPSRGARKRAQRRDRKRAAPKNGGWYLTARQSALVLATVAIFFLVIYPNILPVAGGNGRKPAFDTARAAQFAPSNAWVSSLDWMRDNTPDPFGDPDAYAQRYTLPPAGENYTYPGTAYGVTAWWDYGYWITRIARRIPNANPGQRPEALTSVANFFTSLDETSATEIARKMDSAYVIVDFETALGKFYAVVTWAGKEQSQFTEIYYARQENQIVPVTIYYPAYYRSLAIRLYNFDGEAITPQITTVISYEPAVSQEGIPFKKITGAEQFTSYEAAEAYLLERETGNYLIAGINPFVSPVPLETLEHYRLVHSSEDTFSIAGIEPVAQVKIFEYID